MSGNLIVMLTSNDVTVANALQLFEESKNLPVLFWGFKDIGLPVEAMKELARCMKKAGKTTFLEVVRNAESECLEAAELALKCSFDYLTGGLYYDSVLASVRGRSIRYFPFFGRIHGHPVLLDGEITEIVDHGKELVAKGVDGLDLVAYRYREPTKVRELLRACTDEIRAPLISAGSINTWERLQETRRSGVWAFTIGGAFLDARFVPGAGYASQILAVCKGP